ncbi:nucleotide exchange factor GrpE [uncultured Cocleimonas sp.]|uniref:nucleotide exchange factor GrpE n=1 Tax=uncultured Cocleimonas sp. TaxID=1051587 RepID=UPI0026164D1F|nr:nucleotide exchange factor GrpE [uncultured Cocleimonas sp.]
MSESENNSNQDNMENNVENNVDNIVENDVNQQEEASAEMPNGAEEVTIESLQQKLEEAEAKANDNWDKALRIQAEMDNLRKRCEKQVEDAHKYSVKKFVEEILPVADSLEMGYAVEGEVEQIREGIGLTMNVLKAAMEKFNVIAVDPLGEKFNPDLHQAMAMQPSEEYENDHVSAVMQKGYTLNGRLVRPAMVMVAKN